MFGCTFIDHGTSSSFGNVISVEGQDGSIAQGMEYDYSYQEGPDNFVDEIGESGGTIFFKSQDSKGRAVCYSGPTEDYRAIHSTIIFGALTNGTDTKYELMQRYMDYLIEPTGIEEFGVEKERVIFSVFPNPVRTEASISFSVPKAAQGTVSIYNTAGQLVYRFGQKKFDGGTQSLVWNTTDTDGRKVASGTYIFSLNLDEGTASKPVVVLR